MIDTAIAAATAGLVSAGITLAAAMLIVRLLGGDSD